MPGSIKIDDGSGNYTILTNAGSLGSDKTITIPNETATLATTNGITQADLWRLTANITGTDATISSNLERVDEQTNVYIGGGMSVSSGIWTFPTTGIWRVTCKATLQVQNGDSNAFVLAYKTTNNSSYDQFFNCVAGNQGSSTVNYSSSMSGFLDVTDTTQVKVRFDTFSMSASTILVGNTNNNNTIFEFIRLGDT